MQPKGCGAGVKLSESSEQGEEIPLRHPAAENQAAEGAREPTSNNGATDAKLRLRRFCPEFASNAERYAHRHPQAEQISDKLRKLRSGIGQHAHGTAGIFQHGQNPCGDRHPQEECRPHTPDQSRTRAGRTLGEEQAKSEPEKTAKQNTMR